MSDTYLVRRSLHDATGDLSYPRILFPLLVVDLSRPAILTLIFRCSENLKVTNRKRSQCLALLLHVRYLVRRSLYGATGDPTAAEAVECTCVVRRLVVAEGAQAILPAANADRIGVLLLMKQPRGGAPMEPWPWYKDPRMSLGQSREGLASMSPATPVLSSHCEVNGSLASPSSNTSQRVARVDPNGDAGVEGRGGEIPQWYELFGRAAVIPSRLVHEFGT
ncbi:hypothetical protein B0H14DRAFT_2579194 [Mycena olivaceomarginata]|nr:hypothetical protein B0H14DRAFT_2579194 [Mycena olivaceomarginata]